MMGRLKHFFLFFLLSSIMNFEIKSFLGKRMKERKEKKERKMCHTQGSPYWFYVVSWPGKLSLIEDSLVLESIEAKRMLTLWYLWRECLRLAFNFVISLCESHLDQIWSQGFLWLYFT